MPSMFIHTVFLLTVMSQVNCFLPTRMSAILPSDYTREDIATFGILNGLTNNTIETLENADEQYILAPLKHVSTEAGMTDPSGILRAIEEIVFYNTMADETFYLDPARTFSDEKIIQGHQLLLNLRRRLLQILSRGTPDYSAARQTLGEIFYTIQMFYSNTNWIEMGMNRTLSSLGIESVPFPAVAPRSVPTCKACGHTHQPNCRNNLITGQMLTSGYRTSATSEKYISVHNSPHIADAKTGKCRHGGVSDRHTFDDFDFTVSGGINKQSGSVLFSPHSHLHKVAARLAINHIADYIYSKPSGLETLIGELKFTRLFGVVEDHVTVAIDNDDSSATIAAHVSASLWRQGLNTVPFSPNTHGCGAVGADKGVVVRFRSPKSLLHPTDNEATGQCPYPSFRYIDIYVSNNANDSNGRRNISETGRRRKRSLGGLDLYHLIADTSGGTVYETDKTNIAEVVDIIKAKTGRRRKRSLGGLDLYHLIADTSGGTVYETDKTNIAEVVDIIKESVTSKPPVSVLKFKLTSSMNNTFIIPVDDRVTNLTIKIQSSMTSSPRLNLYHPSGSQELFRNSSVATKKLLGIKLLVIRLFSPTAGTWRMRRMSTLDLLVDVVASTDLDFTYKLMTPGLNGYGEYPLTGRPIAGTNTSVQVSVPTMDSISSVDYILLLDDNGVVQFRETLVNIGGRRGKTLFKSHIVMPFSDFKVAIEGKDKTGNLFRRLNPIKVSTLAIELLVLPSSGTLYINQTITIPYVVGNEGGGTDTIRVTISDDKGFAQSPVTGIHTILSHQNATGSFTLKAGPDKGITTTVTISAKVTGTAYNQVQYSVQRITVEEKIVTVLDKTPPSCNVTRTSGTCDVGTDVCKCSNLSWEMTAVVGDVGDGLFSAFPSGAGNSSTFIQDPFNPGHKITDGIINAKLSADCCHQHAKITVVDMAGNVGLCEFTINPGFVAPNPKLCSIKQQPAGNTNTNTTIISCHVTNVTNTCNVSGAASSPGCKNYTWSFISHLGKEGYGKVNIAPVNAGNAANISRANNTIYLSTDCCHPSVVVNAIDIAGNTGRCSAKVAVFKAQITTASTAPEQSGSGWTSSIGVIVGGTVGGLVVVGGVISFVVYLALKAPTTKVNPISEVSNRKFKN